MAIPQEVLSTSTITGEYIPPYGRPTGPYEDWELGGIGVQNTSEPLDYQQWRMTYVYDRSASNYGDFILEGMKTGVHGTVLNVSDVTDMAFAFDQNMNLFILYVLSDCTCKYYWWDPVVVGYTTTTMDSGVTSPACVRDDHRELQDGTSDIILAYIRAGNLYFRQERERYLTEHLLMSGVGMTRIERMGLTKVLRLQIQLDSGSATSLARIVKDITDSVGVDRVITEELELINVRGFMVAEQYSAADTIKALQRLYLFDFPEVNGFLWAQERGQAAITTIDQDQMLIDGVSLKVETAREQAVEFPYKLHVNWAAAETDYTPTKATSERRASDIYSRSELRIETAVNLENDEAQERADILHKVAWNEQEMRAEFSVDESFKYLVPSNVVSVEVFPDTFRRMRITEARWVDGMYQLKAVRDRVSAYTSGETGPTRLSATAPSSITPAATEWEFMDLPALLTSHDDLRYYVAAKGQASSPVLPWRGAQIQRQVGSDWGLEAAPMVAEVMGTLQNTVPVASVHIPDTTNTVLVDLPTAPESITDDLLYAGRGAWLMGNEIIQVRDWVQEGAYYRGSHLLRGRLDTTPAAVGASPATRFVFLGSPVSVGVDVGLLDTSLQLRAVSVGATPAGSGAAYTFTGKSQEEWAPERLTATNTSPLGDWSLSWVPRYRLGNSATPIPSSNFYGWVIRFTAGSPAVTVSKVIETITPSYTYTEADQITDFGGAQASFDAVEIRALNWLGGEGKALTEAIAA